MNRSCFPRTLRCSSLALLALAAACASGCGGNVISSGGSSNANSTVTILATSTANDQLASYETYLQSLTLISTEGAGTSVNLVSRPLHLEFIHVNGATEPALTVTIPQGTYSSAQITIGTAEFQCIALDSSGALSTNFFVDGATANSKITVNLPSPIKISDTTRVLSLDLQVSKSATWTACHPNGIQPYTVTPTFNLSALSLSSAPTNSKNGLLSDLKGIVKSVGTAGNEFTLTADEGPGCGGTAQASNCTPPAAYAPVWSVASNSGTTYEGLTSFSQLTAGMAVNMDAALQPDGTLLAKRISVLDTSTDTLTIADGPLVFVSPAVGYQNLTLAPVREFGPLALAPIAFSYSAATFHTSSQFTNLSSLPFVPTFTADTAVNGQNLYVTTHAIKNSAAPTYVPAATFTLLPQTINGTVGAIDSVGGFTAYTVTLADYDLFPQLAVQSGQTTKLTSPKTIVVYAGSTTQSLNTQSIAVGSVVRFRGLVFNDSGALRMDCSEISDGVPE